jgi:hypothetical protein
MQNIAHETLLHALDLLIEWMRKFPKHYACGEWRREAHLIVRELNRRKLEEMRMTK